MLLSLTRKHLTRREQNGKTLTFACPHDSDPNAITMEEDEFGGSLILSDDNKKLGYLFTQNEIAGLEVLLKKAKERIYGW